LLLLARTALRVHPGADPRLFCIAGGCVFFLDALLLDLTERAEGEQDGILSLFGLGHRTSIHLVVTRRRTRCATDTVLTRALWRSNGADPRRRCRCRGRSAIIGGNGLRRPAQPRARRDRRRISRSHDL